MANREKGEVSLDLGGRVYTLVLKTQGVIALQEHFSTKEKLGDLDEIIQKAAAGSVKHIVAVIWASLLKYHPMTYAECVEMIDEAGGVLAIASAAIASLADSTTPDPEDIKVLGVGGAKNPQKAQAKKAHGRGAVSTFTRAESA